MNADAAHLGERQLLLTLLRVYHGNDDGAIDGIDSFLRHRAKLLVGNVVHGRTRDNILGQRGPPTGVSHVVGDRDAFAFLLSCRRVLDGVNPEGRVGHKV